eukprot:TRINITY_DN6556_c0_g1_i2.p1 TRINITY_DN6556_c0_g1~~TRINITY_DN6556_c0_g1_i2.p1  ORF type:complete len:724 (+),score=133.57 TRINITY_DN6556_c0_g1_i2:49-2220(+)
MSDPLQADLTARHAEESRLASSASAASSSTSQHIANTMPNATGNSVTPAMALFHQTQPHIPPHSAAMMGADGGIHPFLQMSSLLSQLASASTSASIPTSIPTPTSTSTPITSSASIPLPTSTTASASIPSHQLNIPHNPILSAMAQLQSMPASHLLPLLLPLMMNPALLQQSALHSLANLAQSAASAQSNPFVPLAMDASQKLKEGPLATQSAVDHTIPGFAPIYSKPDQQLSPPQSAMPRIDHGIPLQTASASSTLIPPSTTATGNHGFNEKSQTLQSFSEPQLQSSAGKLPSLKESSPSSSSHLPTSESQSRANSQQVKTHSPTSTPSPSSSTDISATQDANHIHSNLTGSVVLVDNPSSLTRSREPTSDFGHGSVQGNTSPRHLWGHDAHHIFGDVPVHSDLDDHHHHHHHHHHHSHQHGQDDHLHDERHHNHQHDVVEALSFRPMKRMRDGECEHQHIAPLCHAEPKKNTIPQGLQIVINQQPPEEIRTASKSEKKSFPVIVSVVSHFHDLKDLSLWMKGELMYAPVGEDSQPHPVMNADRLLQGDALVPVHANGCVHFSFSVNETSAKHMHREFVIMLSLLTSDKNTVLATQMTNSFYTFSHSTVLQRRRNVKLRTLSYAYGPACGGVSMHLVGAPFVASPLMSVLFTTIHGKVKVPVTDVYNDCVAFFNLPPCPGQRPLCCQQIEAFVQITNDGRNYSDPLVFTYVIGSDEQSSTSK